MATLDACRQILARLRPLREQMPGATLPELATAAFFQRVDLSAHGFFVVDEKRLGFDFGVPPGVKPDGTPDQAARGFAFNYFTQGVGMPIGGSNLRRRRGAPGLLLTSAAPTVAQ